MKIKRTVNLIVPVKVVADHEGAAREGIESLINSISLSIAGYGPYGGYSVATGKPRKQKELTNGKT